jgi:hypothetical protein
MQVTRHDSRRVTPFGHPGITARLTAPPGLSRPPTSFIGPWYQGIHRPPLPTYPHTQHTHTYRRTTNTKMLASTMQISTHHQPTTSHPPHEQATSHAWHQTTTTTPATAGPRPRADPAPRTGPHPAAGPAQQITQGCSLRTPTGCSAPHHAPRPRTFPHPTRHRRAAPPPTGRNTQVVLDAPATKPAELASVSKIRAPGPGLRRPRTAPTTARTPECGTSAPGPERPGDD